MAAITHSTEIARTPEEVFAYATDFAHFADWQVNVISVRLEGAAPAAVGTRAVVTRRAGPREVRGPEEIMDLNPPRSWTVRGATHQVTAIATGTIEPRPAARPCSNEGRTRRLPGRSWACYA